MFISISERQLHLTLLTSPDADNFFSNWSNRLYMYILHQMLIIRPAEAYSVRVSQHVSCLLICFGDEVVVLTIHVAQLVLCCRERRELF